MIQGPHVSMVDVVDSVVAKVRDLHWIPEGQSQPVPIFGEVKKFGSQDWTKLFLWLLRTERTAAAVIPTGLRYEPGQGGGWLKVVGTFAVLVTDRSIGQVEEAIFGGAENAGVTRIGEWVGAALLGGVLPQGGAYQATVTPMNGDQVWIEDADKKNPGRAAYALDAEAVLGRLSVGNGIAQVR